MVDSSDRHSCRSVRSMPVPTVIWIIAQFGWHARDVTARLLPKWFCFGKRAVGTLRILENGRDARLLTAGKGRGTKPGDCGAGSFADGCRRSWFAPSGVGLAK